MNQGIRLKIFAALGFLAASAAAQPSTPRYESFGSFPNETIVQLEVDGPGGKPLGRIRYRKRDGSMAAQLRLPAPLGAMTLDQRYLYVEYRRKSEPRIAVFDADGRKVLDAVLPEHKIGYAVYSSAERIVLLQPHETFAFDAHGKLLCHQQRPEASGPQCLNDPLVAALLKTPPAK